MLQIDDQTLREGLDRAEDLFKLQRLSALEDAEELPAAVFANFGIDEHRRDELTQSLVEMLPISGDPLAEGLMTSSMCAGVLIGLLLANAAMEADPDAVPDRPPVDL